MYITSATVVDTYLYVDDNITLIGPSGAVDVVVEIIGCRNTVYVPAPYGVLLLCAYLSPVEAWNRLRGAIVDAAAKAACGPLIKWLCAAIVRSGPNTHSTLVVPEPSAPLPDAILLQNHHWLLLSHLPGLDPSMNRAVGTRIAETVGEVAVERRETCFENKRVREKKDKKGATEYFGANLVHLLNLVQLTKDKDITPVWDSLTRYSKHQ